MQTSVFTVTHSVFRVELCLAVCVWTIALTSYSVTYARPGSATNNWHFSTFSSSTYLFRLMAVVVHHGDMHSGHFVTYRRSPPSAKNPLSTSNQWLWISDDTVRKASLQEVLSSSAYLLFYERVLSRAQQQGREYRAEE